MKKRYFLGGAAVYALLCSAALAGHPFGARSSGAFPASSQQLLATVTLESPTSATLPVTFGQVFECGTTTKPSTNVANSQTEVIATCLDGSARLANVTVRPTLSAGVPFDVEIYNTTQPEGPDLTPADINAAGLSASIYLDFASATDVDFSLADLDLTTPDWITAQGPEMIEALWRHEPTEDTDFSIFTWIRFYADGRAHVWFTVFTGEYGPQVRTSLFEKIYTPTVTIGGTTAWNNGGAPYTHNEWSRWDIEGWIGGDPEVVYTADFAVMQASGLIPKYWRNTSTETDLNAMYQTYLPGERGTWVASMGVGGWQPGIGDLPNWDAVCITTGGDSRACNSTRANAKSINSYPITFVDSTGWTPKPSDWPTGTVNGTTSGDGQTDINTGGGLTWDHAHHGSSGYLAYLLDAHPANYFTMLNTASKCYFMVHSNQGSGLSRAPGFVQDRTRAWCKRSLGQSAVVARADDAAAQEYVTLLINHVTAEKGEVDATDNDLGFFYYYVSGSSNCQYLDQDSKCVKSVFMNYFWIMEYARLDQLDVLPNETNLHQVLDFSAGVILGLGGPGGADAFCFNQAWNYYQTVSDGSLKDTTTWYKDSDPSPSAWKKAYDASCGNTVQTRTCETPLTTCSPTILSGGESMEGQPGNYLAALGAILERSTLRSEALAVLNRFKTATAIGAGVGWSTITANSPGSDVWAIGDPVDFN